MRTRYLFVCITTLALRVSSGAKFLFWIILLNGINIIKK